PQGSHRARSTFLVVEGRLMPTAIKVLIVDDDEVFRRSTARTLTGHGYTCLEAASGAQARVLLDTERDVAAVLCDIKMPGQSGIDLLRDLHADFPELAV